MLVSIPLTTHDINSVQCTLDIELNMGRRDPSCGNLFFLFLRSSRGIDDKLMRRLCEARTARNGEWVNGPPVFIPALAEIAA